jgi:hypothetical protein
LIANLYLASPVTLDFGQCISEVAKGVRWIEGRS